MKATLLTVAISAISVGKLNPRKDFNEVAMKELADSIKEKGILQPLLLRPLGKDKYELVCGNRRLLAAKAAGVQEIPAKIEEMTDDQAIEAMIIENMQRVDVHPMEEAAAMKHLIDKKGKTIQDISTTIGKPASYVAKRLKLNDLIDVLQRGYVAGDMKMETAFNVCVLTKEYQEAIVKTKRYKVGNSFNVSDWDIRQYKQDLRNAPFDTKDPNLKKEMGACEGCQHNTAANTVLFPELAGQATCLLAKCFQEKAELSYKQELAKSIEDPAIILVVNHQEMTAPGNALIKQGHTVLKSGYNWGDNSDFEVVNKPDKKSIETGKFNKAFVVDGTNKGLYIYIKIKKKSPGKVKKGSAPEKINVQAEIKRMADNEKRKKELDSEKMLPLYYDALEKNKNFLNDKPLSKTEMVAAIIVLGQSFGFKTEMEEKFEKLTKYDISGSNHGDRGAKEYFKIRKETPATLQKNINLLVRCLILDKCLPFKGENPDDSCRGAAIVELAGDYCPVQAKKINADQMEVRKKREASLKARIDQLKSVNKKK